MDGEIVAWSDNKPMDFHFLQTRIGRKNLSKKFLTDVPVRFIAYDLLEFNGKDIREIAFQERRKMLQSIISPNDTDALTISPLLSFNDVDTLVEKRKVAAEYYAEGLMLKRISGMYHIGRKTGDMWKWKKDPFTLDAVMIYAQRGHGRRANLFSDFTFALRDGEKLLPFAKAYTGLTDAEMKEITAYVKNNTIETFGPVCSIRAELVFELAFEGISISKRHKSGFSVRFPRINRWRKDKSVNDIDTIVDIKRLLEKD
jgi:DNA ligase-1